MKIAFSISGIPRCGTEPHEFINQDFNRNLDSWRAAFPSADFYFGTWEQYREKAASIFTEYEVTSFEEPCISYHPFYDMKKEVMYSDRLLNVGDKYAIVKDVRQNRYIHQTKQILAHAFMIDHYNLKSQYDIIVRSRYDTFISWKSNFESIIEEIYNEKKAAGFAVSNDNLFNSIVKLKKSDRNSNCFLLDSLIIHSSEIFDPQHVYHLDKNELLLPCEFGWFQTMSLPYGENHVCYSGWCNADRSLSKKWFTR